VNPPEGTAPIHAAAESWLTVPLGTVLTGERNASFSTTSHVDFCDWSSCCSYCSCMSSLGGKKLLLVDLYGDPLHLVYEISYLDMRSLHLQLLISTFWGYDTQFFVEHEILVGGFDMFGVGCCLSPYYCSTSGFFEIKSWLDWYEPFAYSYWTLPLLSVTSCLDGNRINNTELGCDLTCFLDSHLLV
jgi:hypothetical protein